MKVWKHVYSKIRDNRETAGTLSGAEK